MNLDMVLNMAQLYKVLVYFKYNPSRNFLKKVKEWRYSDSYFRLYF